ncbi:MAG: hypothetical protein U9R19_07265, partial [Bacteroidota bacterium]|nr:hypothetical protein [Bacteroidota bacterium]
MKTILFTLVICLVALNVYTQPLSLDQNFNLNFNFYSGYTSNGSLSSMLKLDNGDLIVSGSFDFMIINKTYGDMVRLSQN